MSGTCPQLTPRGVHQIMHLGTITHMGPPNRDAPRSRGVLQPPSCHEALLGGIQLLSDSVSVSISLSVSVSISLSDSLSASVCLPLSVCLSASV